jgi:hypothetical protein
MGNYVIEVGKSLIRSLSQVGNYKIVHTQQARGWRGRPPWPDRHRRRDGRPRVLQPPQELPRLCRQTAITIAPGTGARYRQDLPCGSPAWHARYATLRNTHRGPQRLRQRPRPPGPRPARTAPRPRHRRPVRLHRPAAHGREHPQDPRLARPHRPRQGPHHPAGTAAQDQPARLPPRRLTHKQSPPPDYLQPARSATLQASPQHPATGPRRSRPRRTATSSSAGARHHTKNRPPPEFCRYDTGSSVGNPGCAARDLNPNPRIKSAAQRHFSEHLSHRNAMICGAVSQPCEPK